jgi:hypothetical protein
MAGVVAATEGGKVSADVFVKEIGDKPIPEGAIPAVSTPTLIVKVGDTYWVPVALQGFRLADALDADEVAGCNAVIARFDAAVDDGTHVAVLVTGGGISAFAVPSDQSTNPHR